MQEFKMPTREQNSNKGTFGKVLNFAGSKNYIGAAYLSTVAILKIGAGFAALATEKDIIRSVSTLLPEAVYLSHKEGLEKIDEFSVVLIGCGLGMGERSQKLFHKVIKRLDCHGSNEPRNDIKPVVSLLTKYIYPRNDAMPVVSSQADSFTPKALVIDADGLNILASSAPLGATHVDKWSVDNSETTSLSCSAGSTSESYSSSSAPLAGEVAHSAVGGYKTIITPHPLEAARLLGVELQDVLEDLESSAKKLCEKYNCVTVLKTHRTIICDGKEIYINQHGNSALAKAGSGDVLAGIIAGLLASSKLTLFDAAKLGVYLHSRTGEIASEELTEYSVLASDLPNYLPKAIKEIS